MKRRAGIAAFLLLTGLWLPESSQARDDPKPDRPFVPTEAYETREVQGWTLHVNKALLAAQKDQGDSALVLLDRMLKEISETVPPGALVRLRAIPIWLGVNDGHAPCAEYHPSRDWLVKNGYNPDKARCVEIGNAERFVAWSTDQPAMVLHELAHGYHDRVLGFSHKGIAQEFRRARASGRYDSVRHVRGHNEKHYALTDEHEFFAELSECYFAKNDFEPFTKAEFEQFDPESARLIASLWNRGEEKTDEGDKGDANVKP
jgi:hypothetical protein